MDSHLCRFDDDVQPIRDDCLLLDEEWSTQDPHFIIENRGNEKEKKPLEPEESDFYKLEDDHGVEQEVDDRTLALRIDRGKV
ncbi:MAG: hypothetical protein K2N69_00980, partial [Helicobacter sp.]|nr:hypothetical protein [Helicobacter sp.]